MSALKIGKIFRKIALILAFVMLLTSTVGTTYGYMITATEPLINVFVPESVALGSLRLVKVVEHPLGDDYKIPDNIVFPMELEMGAYYANARITTSQGVLTADQDGRLQVQVKPNVEFSVDSLQAGRTVKVTELSPLLPGFAIKGAATQEVTVAEDTAVLVTVTNQYTPASAKGNGFTLAGTKTLEGRDWKEGDTFTVKLEQQSGNDWKELGTKSVTYDPKNKDYKNFDFNDVLESLTFSQVGTYTFRLSEVVGNLENVVYDQTVNHFRVVVTDQDMDGKLEIREVTGTENTKVTFTDGKFQVEVPFNNTYVPPELPEPTPVEVQIRVNKTVNNTGSKKLSPKDFSFLLEKNGTHDKWEVKSDGAGRADFKLSFTKADAGKTYTYRLTETDTARKGVTYDTRAYEITVTVKWHEDSNTLSATVKVDGKETVNPTAAFKNTYYVAPADNPQTGDPSNVSFWLIMMAVSGTAFAALLIYDIKQRKKETA